MPKKADKSSDDTLIAEQTRSTAIYEITVAQTIEGAAIVCLASDRVELRTVIGDANSVITCEIVRRVNQNNAAWLIYAVDPDDNS